MRKELLFSLNFGQVQTDGQTAHPAICKGGLNKKHHNVCIVCLFNAPQYNALYWDGCHKFQMKPPPPDRSLVVQFLIYWAHKFRKESLFTRHIYLTYIHWEENILVCHNYYYKLPVKLREILRALNRNPYPGYFCSIFNVTWYPSLQTCLLKQYGSGSRLAESPIVLILQKKKKKKK